MKFIKIQTKESSFWIDVTTIKIVSITGLLVTIQFHEDKAGYPGETKEFLLTDEGFVYWFQDINVFTLK